MKKNTLITVIISFLVVGVIVFSFKKENQNNEDGQKLNSVSLVDSTTFSNLVKDESSFLLDVHIPEQTHIPGTDAFIPYNQISQNLDSLPQDKSTPILVYCRSGSMSKTASEEIIKLGYTNVYDLEGGINIYKESNVEVTMLPKTQDLGKVIYGDVAKTILTLTNFTPLPIKITRVSTSCGCTKAEVEKNELGAYESTEITVSFDPAVHKDDTDLGNLTRTIYISTDNPNFPKLESTFTANVIKE
ncbi:DUF1573 domain-containing protein [Candidatus Microgenomates bacterium]|nr:DUF1573 domain-containing protein [Candidatus Microgenomates bacterium]